MDVTNYIKSESSFVTKDDIGQARPVLTISAVDLVEVDNQQRLVVMFAGKEKGLPLNKTNGQLLAGAYGTESGNWIGQQVTLWVDATVMMAGKVVGGLRLTPSAAAAPAAPTAPPVAPPAAASVPPDEFDDDIPF